jgi:hypothetical protein
MLGMTFGALPGYRRPERHLQHQLVTALGTLALAWSFVFSVLAHVYAPFPDMTAGPLTGPSGSARIATSAVETMRGRSVRRRRGP